MDRDHIVFRDSLPQVEHHIHEIEEILKNFPEQKVEDEYQSYFYEKKDEVEILFINNKKVSLISELNSHEISRVLHCDPKMAEKFIKSSIFLNDNGLSGAINSCVDWGFFYKASNDRGQYRLIKVVDDMTNFKGLTQRCGFRIIDKRENLALLKFNDESSGI